MNDTATSPALLVKLTACCRHLTDHLTAYAVSAENFDEEAYIACTMAESVLLQVEHVYGDLDEPQVLSDLRVEAKERIELD